MTEQIEMEIVKAFAYEKTPEEVADVTGMSLIEAEKFKYEHASAIEKKKTELKEAGYLG